VLTLNIRYMGSQDAGERSWDARKVPARLCIEKHNPDVVCLQEAVKRQVNDAALTLTARLPRATLGTRWCRSRDDSVLIASALPVYRPACSMTTCSGC